MPVALEVIAFAEPIDRQIGRLRFLDSGRLASVLHPLVDPKDGSPLYPDAEPVLASVPKRGIPLVLKARRVGTSEPYTAMQMAKIVRKAARALVSRRPLRSMLVVMAT
jgi:hypothetical protein